MNLYQYVGSSPVSHVDPLGLWKFNRKGQAKATVIAERDDTIEGLAKEIGLNPEEWHDWASPHGPVLGRNIPWTKLERTEKLCGGEVIEVPNTVLAYWAGHDWVGLIHGKTWVRWSSDVKSLKNRGFMVVEERGWKTAQLEGYIATSTRAKELQGIFFWGHGGQMNWVTKPAPNWDLLKVFEETDHQWSYLLTDASKMDALTTRIATPVFIKKLRRNLFYNLTDYMSLYQDWRPRYRLGIGILWACGSQAAQQYPIFASGDNTVFAGSSGVLVPHGFHLFGKSVNELIPSGKQGTK